MAAETSLTANQSRAAVLVAEDERTDTEIAAQCGVTQRTLERWKHIPEFAAAVRTHIDTLSRELSRYSIARKDKRVAALQDRWQRMARVIEIRAQNAPIGDEHARTTGLVVREEMVDGGVRYAVDTGLLAEMRNTEKQAAIEVGQWSEKRTTELTGKDGAPIKTTVTHEFDFDAFRALWRDTLATGSGESAEADDPS